MSRVRRSRFTGVAGMLALAIIATGCQLGQAEPRIQAGRATSAAGAISIETGDWTYSVPLEGVMWVDAIGPVHGSGRPDCLAAGTSREIDFVAVEVTVRGTMWRPVVWVSCQ